MGRRIAVREAVRAVRGGRTVPVDPAHLAPLASVPDAATAVEVRAVLDQLAPEQRAVLVLRHVDGLDEAEMAEALGVGPGHREVPAAPRPGRLPREVDRMTDEHGIIRALSSVP